MKSTSTVLLTLGLLACNGSVAGDPGGAGKASGGSTASGDAHGGSTTSGDAHGGSTTSGGTGGSVPAPTAIAILGSQASWLFGDGGSSTADPGDPDMLYLELGNPPSCSTVLPSHATCGTGFNVTIGVPTTLQTVGTISLADPTLTIWYGDVSALINGSCMTDDGYFTQGTLQILSTDATQLVFTLSGTTPPKYGVATADGTYTAPRCP